MNFKKRVFLMIGLSIAVKVIFLLISRSYCHIEPFEYENIASNMLKGGGFYFDHFNTRYYGYHSFGFPVLCYIVYKLFGHHQLIVVFIQMISTSLVVLPVSYIARKIFNEKTAILAGFLTALYPPFIIYSTMKLHTMNVDALLFALCLLSFIELKDNAGLNNSIYAGAISGLAFLFRPTIFLFTMLALTLFYFTSLAGIKKRLIAIGIVLFTLILVILPLFIRSYIVFKDPLVLSTTKAENFWLGNIPGSTGSLYEAKGLALYDVHKKELPSDFFKMNEIEQSKCFTKVTMGYFKSDPKAFIARIFKKAYYFWYFSPNQGSLYPAAWMKLYKVYYIFILLSAIFAILHGLYFKNINLVNTSYVFILFLAFTAVHSLYYVEARHRWAIEPMLLIFTANGIVILTDFINKKIKRMI